MEGAREQHPAGRFVRAHRHEDGFGQRAGAVVEAGIGNIEPGERRHHGLVFVNHLQRALARFRLVRSVGGIEFAAGGDLPNRRRNMMLVGAGADEVQPVAILVSALVHQARYRHFRQRVGHLAELVATQLVRYFVEQLVDGCGADRIEHGANIVVGMGNEGHRKFWC